MFALIGTFLRDESGISGVVVAVALIVIGVLTAYYLYKGIEPGVSSTANNIGKVLQQ